MEVTITKNGGQVVDVFNFDTEAEAREWIARRIEDTTEGIKWGEMTRYDDRIFKLSNGEVFHTDCDLIRSNLGLI